MEAGSRYNSLLRRARAGHACLAWRACASCGRVLAFGSVGVSCRCARGHARAVRYNCWRSFLGVGSDGAMHVLRREPFGEASMHKGLGEACPFSLKG